MIVFSPIFEQEALRINQDPAKATMETIAIDKLQFYISQIELYEGEHLVYAEENSFHLVDATQPTSLGIVLDTPADLTFSALQFNLGVDSLTNVSGAQGGALDPSNGMYWTWQSGYINLKLEGRAADCPARNNRFQFHLGGYQAPGNALQRISLTIPAHAAMNINVSLDDFLSTLDLSEKYQVMSPNQAAVTLAERFAAVFKIAE